MTSGISDFVPISLVETNKYIEFIDEHFVTVKQTGEVQINICDDNIKPFTAELYKVILAPELCC